MLNKYHNKVEGHLLYENGDEYIGQFNHKAYTEFLNNKILEGHG